MIKRILLAVMLGALCATAQEVKRPRITGVSHIALYAHDLAKSRAFYKDFLGFGEPYSLDKGGGASIVFIKINERQCVELFTEKEAGADRLNHISIETDNAAAMRDYLAAKGVKAPDKVGKGRIGNSNFNILDPEGHTVEVVQYEPDGWTAREKGRFMPDTRVSTRMMHAGILVGSLERTLKFYTDILGFQEVWRGSKDGKKLNWVHVKVPEGEDTLELMLYSTPPSPERLGTMNHLCLVVPDVTNAVAVLEQRPARKDYSRKIEVQTGINRRRQANLYDPDGTRVELMEPKTVDGVPAPSSTAPPPK